MSRLKQLDKVSKISLGIVVDLDDTVINNTALLITGIKNCQDITKRDTWSDWEKHGKPTLIPGALDFFNYADKEGIRIFYVSDRLQENKALTIEILKALGLPQVSDRSLLFDYDFSKKEQRELITNHTNIIMLLGQDLSNFLEDFTVKVDLIIFPNTDYTSWNKAVLSEYKKNNCDEI